MLKIGHSTSENNPYGGTGQGAAAGIDTWTSHATRAGTGATGPVRPGTARSGAAQSGTAQSGTARPGTERSRVAQTGFNARFAPFVTTAVGLAADCAAGLPRRMAGRLFAINDDESYWRGWQIIKVHRGFGRRYRDPKFDTLLTCGMCKGTGLGAIELARLSLPCGVCLGTGRLATAEGEPGLATAEGEPGLATADGQRGERGRHGAVI